MNHITAFHEKEGKMKSTVIGCCFQEQVGSGPPYNPMSTSLLISTSPSSVIYSVAASSSMVTNTPTKDVEPMRRRFTEEKDDKIPENLLGYQVEYF